MYFKKKILNSNKNGSLKPGHTEYKNFNYTRYTRVHFNVLYVKTIKYLVFSFIPSIILAYLDFNIFMDIKFRLM